MTRSQIVDRYIAKIDTLLSTTERKDKFVAIGECGLDYDRFEYADKET
jgi:Tat protein secretion system quality control protein TatD with DNase activity